MTRQKNSDGSVPAALREIALRFPAAEEGIACKGTALECAAFMARKKTFLFVRKAEVMVKLQESLGEAASMASKEPGRYRAGGKGWVTVKFGAGEAPSMELLEKWIHESYRAVADKRLVAELVENGLRVKKKAAKKN